jgi:hypothetical protein
MWGNNGLTYFKGKTYVSPLTPRRAQHSHSHTEPKIGIP